MTVLFGILGLGLLMVVHELGHYLAARAFKMRVTRFSIGFGPALFRHTPKGSPTTYQIAIIPLLAYVQIAGMNPLEDVAPNDEGSYANASLFGRITTIVAGPLANYLFASVLFFGAMVIGGLPVPTTKVAVQPGSAAEAGQMKTGDKVVEVAGKEITEWDQMRTLIAQSPNKPVDIGVEREGKVVHLNVTPATIASGEGRIGVEAQYYSRPATMRESVTYAVKKPAEVVADTMIGLGQMLTGKQKADLAGPVGIVRETARAARGGLAPFFSILGLISAYLGAFNLLPIPALDGGRLMFLAYEATTRRRPDPKVEAQVHAVGLVMMLALVLVVTFVIDIPGRGH
ncbi:MAG TPA: M50 family metallopeptidase [Polyangiaceae bacterium]|nr:M50 family metallopeptidase [Polyangiaceae bacterium]